MRLARVLALLALTAMPLTAVHADPGTAALTGVVLLDGRPVSGATVTLTVLPAPGTFTDAPYRAEPTATSKSGIDGQFFLPLPAGSRQLLDLASLNDDAINFWVQAFYNDIEESGIVGDPADPDVGDPADIVWGGEGTAFSAATLAYSTVMDTGATDPADDVTGLVLSMPDPVTLELTTYSTGDQTVMTGSRTVGGLPGQSAGGGGSECRSKYAPYVTVLGHEVDYQPVGEAHVMYDSTGHFDYGQHANTDLTGAYSMKGGPWSVSTTANHMGNKGGMVSKPFSANEAYVVHTGFRYRKERLDFTDDDGDGHVCRSDYRVIPEGWVAGYMLGADVSGYDSAGQMDAARGKGWATLFRGAGSFVKNTAKGEKYTYGVKAFDIGLSAQSKWSKQVDIFWSFGNDGDHWLYGSNAPITDARTVYAW